MWLTVVDVFESHIFFEGIFVSSLNSISIVTYAELRHPNSVRVIQLLGKPWPPVDATHPHHTAKTKPVSCVINL